MFSGINCETERASPHTLETASLLIFMREMHVGTVLKRHKAEFLNLRLASFCQFMDLYIVQEWRKCGIVKTGTYPTGQVHRKTKP